MKLQGITLAQEWALYLLTATHDEGTDKPSRSKFRKAVEDEWDTNGHNWTTAFWGAAKALDSSIQPIDPTLDPPGPPPVGGLDGPHLRAALPDVPYQPGGYPCPNAAQQQIYDHLVAIPPYQETAN